MRRPDLDHPQRLLRVVERDHQQAGALGAGGAQQVGPGRVAVIDLVAEAADHLDLLRALLQRGEGDAAHPQDAADDLPDPAEAADDDGRAIVADRVVGRLRMRLQARDQQPFRRGEQQRRGGHRQRDRQASRGPTPPASGPPPRSPPRTARS